MIPVGHAESRRHAHVRVLLQHRLHLRRVHVEAVDNDEVLLALHDPRVAVVIDRRDVAGVEPAPAVGVRAQGARRLLRLVPVARHDLRPADTQFAGFASRQVVRAGLHIDHLDVGVRHRQADGARLAHAEQRRAVGDGRRFRQPEPFEERSAERSLELVDGRLRQRGRAARAEADAVEPVVGRVWPRQQGGPDGRHRREVRGHVVANRLEHGVDVERREEQLRSADPGTLHHSHGEPEDVKERDDEQVARLAARARPVGVDLRLHDVREDVAVRQHRPLGRAGGAARVLQDRHVVGLDRHAGDRGEALTGDQVGKGEAPVEARRRGCGGRVLGERGDDDLLDGGLRLNGLDDGRQGVEGDDGANAGVDEQRQQFGGGVCRVQIDDDGAAPEHGERGHEVLRAVRQHDADAVALADAEAGQRIREPVRPHLDVAVGEGGAQKDGGGTVRDVHVGGVEDLPEGPLRIGDAGWNPVVVVSQPGTTHTTGIVTYLGRFGRVPLRERIGSNWPDMPQGWGEMRDSKVDVGPGLL